MTHATYGQIMFLCVMHIDTIPNRGSRPTYLLRESVRDGDRVRKVKLANLTSLPLEQIEMIRRVLKGERLGAIEGGLDCLRSQHHGHVEAVRLAMTRLGFDKLVDATASRQRDLVVAMVTGRIIAPSMIGVGIGFRRPLPPNRTGGFPAYGSPVGGFFIEAVSLLARLLQVRTVRHSRRRRSASADDRLGCIRDPAAYPVCAGPRAGVVERTCRS